jgi:Circularly permutated YpsA SLOG family
MALKKIISGGRSGAEWAALDAAIELDIPYGGWVSRGRQTPDGPVPDKYKVLEELPSPAFTDRAEKNVSESDGTVLFTHGKRTTETKLLEKITGKHRRYFLHIDLSELPLHMAASVLRAWVDKHGIEVLNVTGPRPIGDPTIYLEVYKVVQAAVRLEPLGDNPTEEKSR